MKCIHSRIAVRDPDYTVITRNREFPRRMYKCIRIGYSDVVPNFIQ